MKMIYIVFENNYILDKIFDTAKEAQEYIDYCKRNYIGVWSYKVVENKNFKKGLTHYDKAITI